MERKHRALLLALPTVLTLLFFFVAPMVYILVHTLHENGFSDFVGSVFLGIFLIHLSQTID